MFEKILIATFSLTKNGKRTPINGMVEPLLSYFLPRATDVDLIDGTHPGSDTVLTYYEQYRHGEQLATDTSVCSKILASLLTIQNNNATQISFKIRDMLAVIEWVIRKKTHYDLFIGLESIYTLIGIWLRFFGKVGTVVYYVSDYSPERYKNKYFNSLYLALDRFCCKHADFIWDVSPAMLPARIASGLSSNVHAPVLLVPNALFPEQFSAQQVQKTHAYHLIYAGTLGDINGPKLAVEAMSIIKLTYPQCRLHIYGGNDIYERQLRQLALKLNLKKHIIFHGFVSNAGNLSHMINTGMIGLAPYRAVSGSPRWYADATKIRLYLGAGLPVVTTHVPPLAKDVQKHGACIITDDTVESFSNGILKIFSNEKLFLKMKKAAILYAKNNTWENSYQSAITAMLQ